MRGMGIVVVVLASLVACCSAGEVDSDGDGLSDFQEVHKYFTNPHDADSDGDGTADGDWYERREYAYTVRTVVKVMRPCNTEAINDDYQDACVLSETEDYVELEVVHYPFNTNAASIKGSRDWKEQPPELAAYLKPGITTNWDEQMRSDLLEALAADGIDVNALSDKETVEQISQWLMHNTKYYPMFGTMYVHFPNGKVEIYPGLEERFKTENNETTWPLPEHFDHELFGKGMYYTKSHGSCTSSAVLLTTVLRAVGIPTRMVLVIPIVDASDPDQREMVKKSIANHAVRNNLRTSLYGNRNSFANHTFNEVFVDGRWRRLNYSTLGDNTYDGPFGLVTHVHTFNDLSEADLTPTWGRRYALRLRDATFRHANPYRTTEVSDRFGIHCELPNPVAKVLVHAPASEVLWFHSDERPKAIPESRYKQDEQGHLLIKVDCSMADLVLLMEEGLDHRIRLTGSGHPSLQATTRVSVWGLGENVCYCYANIPAEEMAKMVDGLAYRFEAFDPHAEHHWQFSEGVSLIGRRVSSDRKRSKGADENRE